MPPEQPLTPTIAAPAAPHKGLPPAAFAEEVRSALDHLYDSALLHNHPLTLRLCGDAPPPGLTRAQRVRTLLLDAIEQLRPEPRTTTDAQRAEDMRAYAILTYRCLEGMAMDEIAARLGLSRRQVYREYAKGVEAIAGLVWDALPPVHSPPTPAAAPLAADASELTTRLDAAAQEVARLAGNLLLEAVDLPAVAANAAELLAPRLEHTGVALHIAPGAPPAPPAGVTGGSTAVMADRALLRQALLNLFSYALDQACRGGEVNVAWVQAEGAARRAAGLQLIACADPARVELGAAGAEAPGRREGVGVSVAQQLIEAMGGAATVEQVGGEWRCTLLLPAAQRDTILVVDDNADLTALFQRYAAGHPLVVVGATSGSQALALAGELHPQLIILDLMLAQMDGWEILQRLRREPATQTTPIVICSVLNERDLAFSLGASDYVTKPISQAAWIDVLRRWLGIQHPVA